MRRKRPPNLLSATLLLFCALSPLWAQLTVSPEQAVEASARLSRLPGGAQKAERFLFLRERQISGVEDGGSARPAMVGYAGGEGVADGALWVAPRSGAEGWASTLVRFKRPLNVSSYDGIVFYVLAGRAGVRFRFELADDAWPNSAGPQRWTSPQPSSALPVGEPVQIFIPFASMQGEAPFDRERLAHLKVEFGADAVGNPPLDGEVVLGAVGFVKWSGTPRRMGMENEQALSGVVAAPVVARSRSGSPRRNRSTNTVAPAMDNMTRHRESFSRRTAWLRRTALVAGGSVALLGLLAVAGWIAARILEDRRREARPSPAQGSTGLCELRLPDTPVGAQNFWLQQHASGLRRAWMSASQSAEDRRSDDEYLGETLLREQVALARAAGVQLFPSLCFTRTLFHYDLFLTNPDLYLTEVVPLQERHLSDEELRVRHVGTFPVWVPPFQQKRFGLSQRLLVHYGRLPGALPLKDMVQFRLNGPALRDMAVRVIERFAGVADGVRIEGAASLLSAVIDRHWYAQMGATEGGEFWVDVIGRVRAKHPRFIFLADAARREADALHSVGFDYVENDHLRDMLMNQLRAGVVGPLKPALSSMTAAKLERFLYDPDPFLNKPSHLPAVARQNALGVVLLGFLPGSVLSSLRLPPELAQCLVWVGQNPVLLRGDFCVLESTSPHVLALARWWGRSLTLVVANFGSTPARDMIGFTPLLRGFDAGRLYLFHDTLHGTSFSRKLPTEHLGGPALAVSGTDIRKTGLPVMVGSLSLRVFSVNLSRTVAHGNASKIQPIHKV